MNMTQCLLAREGDKQIAWIPSWAAKVSNKIEIKEDGNLWSVVEIYSTMDSEALKVQQEATRTHRKGSDI